MAWGSTYTDRGGWPVALTIALSPSSVETVNDLKAGVNRGRSAQVVNQSLFFVNSSNELIYCDLRPLIHSNEGSRAKVHEIELSAETEDFAILQNTPNGCAVAIMSSEGSLNMLTLPSKQVCAKFIEAKRDTDFTAVQCNKRCVVRGGLKKQSKQIELSSHRVGTLEKIHEVILPKCECRGTLRVNDSRRQCPFSEMAKIG